MRTQTTELVSELKGVELCNNLGLPVGLPHRSVASWAEALKLCHGKEWSALQLMTNNRNAGRVNELNWDRFQEWNPTCESLYPAIAQITGDAVARASSTRKVSDHFRHSLSWDVLGILLEREFEDVIPPFFYLPRLLPIYRAGHFPCGWTGPELDTYWSASREPIPKGEILIY